MWLVCSSGPRMRSLPSEEVGSMVVRRDHVSIPRESLFQHPASVDAGALDKRVAVAEKQRRDAAAAAATAASA